MIANCILSTVGNTPLVELTRVLGKIPFRFFAKLEGLNPGGSTKDRPALRIIREAIRVGKITPETVIIESSSGNMGIGLAQVCRYFGLRFICVVDPKTTVQNIRILKAFGAQVDLIQEPDPETGEFLQARIDHVQYLLKSIKNSFWPNQYANDDNSDAHYQTTMHEIATALGSDVDYLFCATSTCGTIRGCAEYVRDHRMKTKIIAVDAIGSLIWGGEKGKRLIPGLGASLTPPLCRPELVDQCVYVSDLDCVVGCRRLVQREAILAGGSSGGMVAGVERQKNQIPAGATCVAIFPDRGERYLDTIYSDEWVWEQFGEVTHLWQSPAEAELLLKVAC
jgi:2,3-diaminopropionate biosynthesis protein SbnA